MLQVPWNPVGWGSEDKAQVSALHWKVADLRMVSQCFRLLVPILQNGDGGGDDTDSDTKLL